MYLSSLIDAILSYADVEGAYAGCKHDVVSTQIALERQLIEAKIGLESVGPIELQREINRRIDICLDIQLRIDPYAITIKTRIQINVDRTGTEFHTAVKNEFQAVLVEPEVEPCAHAGLRSPMVVKILLESSQRRHTQGRVRGNRHAIEARDPRGVQVSVDVALDVIA
jgi:hypothetical protein